MDQTGPAIESASKALEEAYRNTTYRAEYKGSQIDIHVGELIPALDAILKSNGSDLWVFLTAFNPGSTPAGNDENLLCNNGLAKRIRDLGYQALRCDAIDPTGEWPIESGYIVMGMDRETGLVLGIEFGQNAILVGAIGEETRLEFC